MRSLTSKSVLIAALIIVGTGAAGFFFWNNDSLRAATPLVFIFGLGVLVIFGVQGLVEIAPEIPTFFSGQRTIHKLWRDHIPQTITKLYFRHIRNYPEWIRVSRDFVPSCVTLAIHTDEKWVRILLYYADYLFMTNETTVSETEKIITLTIIRENITVMTLAVKQTSYPDQRDNWEPLKILNIAPGPWLREFENMRSEIVAIIKDREREAREN